MDKKTIIAIILVGLIIIFTQTEIYKRIVMPVPQNVPAESSFDEEIIERPDPTEEADESLIESQSITIPAEVKTLDREVVDEFSTLGTEEKVEVINIVSNLFDVKISNKGGGIIQWKLNTYLDADSNNVNLVPNTEIGVPGVGMILSLESIQFDNYIYSSIIHTPSAGRTIFLENENDLFSISYRLDFPEGKSIEKKFTFYGNRYDFDLELNLEGFANLAIDRSYLLRWDSGLLPTEYPLLDDLSYNKVYAYLGDDLQDFETDESERGIESKEVTGTVHWASLRTKYFCIAIAPIDVKGRGIIYSGSEIQIEPEVNFTHYKFAINMPFAAGTNQLNRFSLYLGPIEYNRLKAVNFELEELIMNSGIYESLFRPFSILILICLKFLHKFISNYGIVIIIFSILIKIILYPLTHKSYTSMKKMQLVQPLMTELREKYKGDSQRLNKEMMKLYKDHGVNPLGGCLPMLLQMPLLIGLFIVFRSTIELRGAEFIWWISDLSKPDTIFTLPFSLPIYGNHVTVLPIVMALSMFLQQKSTISDPRQKMMIYFMPVFFLLLFNTFPSGLNLYYTLFNFLTILQQKFVKTDTIQLKPVEKKPVRNKKKRK